MFQTFSRNDLPGEAALSRGRSVFKKREEKKKGKKKKKKRRKTKKNVQIGLARVREGAPAVAGEREVDGDEQEAASLQHDEPAAAVELCGDDCGGDRGRLCSRRRKKR